jgi:uncharacterized coiled-coil protein SlyX
MPPPDTSLDKVKSWLLPGALALINILLTNQINTAASEIRDTRKDIVELASTVKVQSAQMEYLTQRVTNLEAAKSDAAAVHRGHDERLNSLEQRAAIYDEYMSSHKNR